MGSVLVGLAPHFMVGVASKPLTPPSFTTPDISGAKCVSVGAKTMVAMRGDCFYSDVPPPYSRWEVSKYSSAAPVPCFVSPSIPPWFKLYGCVLLWPGAISP